MAGESGYVVRSGRVSWSGAGADPLLPASPQRITVLFSVETSLTDVTIQTTGLGQQDAHFRVPTTGYMEFTYTRHGPLPASEWRVTGSTLGDTVNYVEVLLAPSREVPQA